MSDTRLTPHRRLPAFITRFSALLAEIKISSRAVFIVIGVLSTAWFLVRVLPKPSRASYPCMRAAYPFMSGLFVYLLGLAATLLAFARS